MEVLLTAILVILVVGFSGIVVLILKQNPRSQAQLEQVVNQAFGMSAQKVAEQSRSILQSEKETIKVDLENKQRMLENIVKELQEDIKVRQQEIRLLEKDRVQKFGEISTALDHQRKLTEELRISTQQLATVLSNNQQRGEWGERIIEDLLKSNGLMEGIHYVRQKTLVNSTLRPDISLLLPNDRCVAVDVKFPFSSMQRMALADKKEDQVRYEKQFGIDLKAKIDKVAEYILPECKTLDYAILFVPNEMLFSFINQRFPDLIDSALTQRVILVSPFTFLIVARTVMESYRNFMIGDKLKEVVLYIDDFVGEWSKFKDHFDKYGRSIDTLQKDYEQLSGTRVRQMERKIKKVQEYRGGNFLEEKTDTTEALD